MTHTIDQKQKNDALHPGTTDRRSEFLRVTLWGASIFGLLILVPVIVSENSLLKSIFIPIYILLLTISFLPSSYKVKGIFLIGIFFALAVTNLLGATRLSDGRLYMLGAIILSSILFSWRSGAYVTGLAFVFYSLFGWATLSNNPLLGAVPTAPENIADWLTRFMGAIVLSGLIVNGIRLTQEDYSNTRTFAEKALDNVSNERRELEERYNERTASLDKRTSQLRAVADIGKSITAYRELSEMLQQATIKIHESFNMHHVGVFLLDDRKEFAILTASNSDAGRQMIENGFTLKLDDSNLIGYAAEHLKSKVVADFRSDAENMDSSRLPDTVSELALPLVAGGQIQGILDIQSSEPDAFLNDDITSLNILAEQLAVAIQNDGLFNQTAKALETARANYGQLSREAWSKLLRNQSSIGFLATQPATVGVPGDAPHSDISRAIESGDLIHGSDRVSVSLPVKIRGQVVGAIRMKKPDISESWSQEEITLAIALADQLSAALESARLYRTSLQTASRESLISEISARINALPSRDGIIRETVQELGQALKDASVSFHLLNPSDETAVDRLEIGSLDQS